MPFGFGRNNSAYGGPTNTQQNMNYYANNRGMQGYPNAAGMSRGYTPYNMGYSQPGRPQAGMPMQQNQAGRMQQNGMSMPYGQGMRMPSGTQSNIPQTNMPMQQGQHHQGPLPDGVTFQPLDERTLNELRAELPPTLPSPSPIAAPTTENKETYENTEGLSAKLEKFIQNERNGSIFYKSLAEKASEARHSNILNDISNVCKKRQDCFNGLYQQYKGEPYTARESDIDIYIPYREGLSLAIFEESKNLRELSEIYENMPDQQVSRTLNIQICKKISDLSFLHFLNSR